MGAPICLPHTCSSCGKPADKFGHHSLSCWSSQGRIPRHQMLNDIIHRSLASSNISSRLEPSGLYGADGRWPDGVTLIPWSDGKFLVWDATCVDTFCDSHMSTSAGEAGCAAALAERDKSRKYILTGLTCFNHAIAVETCGSIVPGSLHFLRDLGRRLKSSTREPQSLTCMLQRLSVAIQLGNTSSVLGTLGQPRLQCID